MRGLCILLLFDVCVGTMCIKYVHGQNCCFRCVCERKRERASVCVCV